MTWVIKAGQNDPNDPPHYLHDFDTSKRSTDAEVMTWGPEQSFAFRFVDRNAASRVARSFPICAYDETVRIVKLTPKSTHGTSNGKEGATEI